MTFRRVPEGLDDVRLGLEDQAKLMGEVVSVIGSAVATRSVDATINMEAGNGRLAPWHGKHRISFTGMDTANGHHYVENLALKADCQGGHVVCTNSVFDGSRGLPREETHADLYRGGEGAVWQVRRPAHGNTPESVSLVSFAGGAAAAIVDRARNVAARAAVVQTEELPWELANPNWWHHKMIMEPARLVPSLGKVLEVAGSLVAAGDMGEGISVKTRVAVDMGAPYRVYESPDPGKEHVVELNVVSREQQKGMRFALRFRHLADTEQLLVRAELREEDRSGTGAPRITRQSLQHYGTETRVLTQTWKQGQEAPIEQIGGLDPASPTALVDMAKDAADFATGSQAS